MPETLTNFLEAKLAEIILSREDKEASLANLSTKELQLRARIDELSDTKLCAEKAHDVYTAIENLRKTSLLEKNRNKFNTNTLSRKTSEARDQLIQQNFDEIFKRELSALRKTHIDIDLSFGTDRGNSKMTQNIGSRPLTEILSDGEQKAIALAEFLTELQLDNTKAPVIFDDPVNSLDHKIIEDVARRLISLSRDRQVVVLTHSILLFNALRSHSSLPLYKDLSFKFYNTRNEYNETGIISPVEELNSVKPLIKKLNQLTENVDKSRPEADVASEGYSLLRAAIELFVEHEVLSGTVKRYQKNVALTQFIRVDGKKLDGNKEKINEIFERCCGYTEAHSNPVEVYDDPTIAGLKVDFDEFKMIRDEFVK